MRCFLCRLFLHFLYPHMTTEGYWLMMHRLCLCSGLLRDLSVRVGPPLLLKFPQLLSVVSADVSAAHFLLFDGISLWSESVRDADVVDVDELSLINLKSFLYLCVMCSFKTSGVFASASWTFCWRCAGLFSPPGRSSASGNDAPADSAENMWKWHLGGRSTE